MRAGESSQEAVLREVREETGLMLTASQGKLIHTYRNDSPEEQNNYFVDIYEFKVPFEAADVHVQADEVASYKLASGEELKRLGAAGDFLHYRHIEKFL